MITFIYIIGGIGVLFGLYVMFKPKTAEEKEYDRKLKESLKDEYIIDPETGTKITLEQAESGHWVAHDNEFVTMSETDLEKLLTEQEKHAHIALNYLKESREYRKTELTDEQFEIIASTKILNRYDDWSYNSPFTFANGIVFLPVPELHGNSYYDGDYKESHVMFWLKIENIKGHYYLREKTSAEKLFDKFRNDDDLQLEGYECFTFKRSFNLILINKILKSFSNEEGLEIEIHDENLFVKTLRLINIEDVKRIENVLKMISNTI